MSCSATFCCYFISFCKSFVPWVCYCFRMFVLYLFNGLIKKSLQYRLIFSASMKINPVFVRTNLPTFLSVFLMTHIPAISDVFHTHLLPRCCIFLDCNSEKKTVFFYSVILGNCIVQHKRPREKLTIKKLLNMWFSSLPSLQRPSFVLLLAEPVCACAEVERSGPRSGCRSGSSAGSDRLKATKYWAHLECNDT